jgi:hypothetical protein
MEIDTFLSLNCPECNAGQFKDQKGTLSREVHKAVHSVLTTNGLASTGRGGLISNHLRPRKAAVRSHVFTVQLPTVRRATFCTFSFAAC